jgi:Tol biopolymer transport system component
MPSWLPALALAGSMTAGIAAQPVEVLVKVRPAAPGRSAAPMASRTEGLLPGARHLGELTQDGWQVLELPRGMAMEEALRRLQESGDVEYAEPNDPVEIGFQIAGGPAGGGGGGGQGGGASPGRRAGTHGGDSLGVNDPLAGRQYNLEKIGLAQAWQHSKGNKNVVIAVIESGVEVQNPEISANLWLNDAEIAGNGIDDDRNGYIDDIHGANVIANNGDLTDPMGYGTAAVSVLAAAPDNGVGIAGINWNVQVMMVRVARDGDGAYAGNIIRAMDYITAMRSRGVNIVACYHGWGAYWPRRAQFEAYSRMSAAGILNVTLGFVNRNDRDRIPGFPAGYSLPGNISVAASDHEDHLAQFSDIGAHGLDLAAPGTAIWGILPGGRFMKGGGTGPAALHVAGAAGLLFAKRPDLTAEQAKMLLLNTVDPLPAFDRDRVRSGGRLNVGRAMQWLADGRPLPTTFTSLAPPLKVNYASRTAEGWDGYGVSTLGSVSADGRYVAFVSTGTNMVPGDVNNVADVFLRDRVTDTLRRVSETAAGVGANAASLTPVISADGRTVVFASGAQNLHPDDTSAVRDIYAWDRETGAIEWVSRPATGPGTALCEAPSVSADGNWIAFQTSGALLPEDTNGGTDIYVYDRKNQSLQIASLTPAGQVAASQSTSAAISGNGRYVAFTSAATDLVEGAQNGMLNIYVRDLSKGTTERVSANALGEPAELPVLRPRISHDGRFVAFQTASRNLGPTVEASVPQVYVRDRVEGGIRLASKDATGAGVNLAATLESISGDGRWVVFRTTSRQLPPAEGPSLSHLYAFDRLADDVVALSYNDAGDPLSRIPSFLGVTDNGVVDASISQDGRHVTITSASFALSPSDGNMNTDVFVSDRGAAPLDLSVKLDGAEGEVGRGLVGAAIPQQAVRRLEAAGGVTKFEFRLVNRGGTNPAPRLKVELDTAGASVTWPAGSVAEANGVRRLAPLAPGESVLFTAIVPTPAGDGPGRLRIVAGDSAVNGGFASTDGVTALVIQPRTGRGAELASVGLDGAGLSRHAIRPGVSDDGTKVVFGSIAGDAVPGDIGEGMDVFLRDLARGETDLAAGVFGNDWSCGPQVSADGRYVVFTSYADNLGADANFTGDTFRRDLSSGVNAVVTRRGSSFGNLNSSQWWDSKISADGQVVAFQSHASNLAAGDTNRTADIFVANPDLGTSLLITRNAKGEQANGSSEMPQLSRDGRFVAFTSLADNLVENDGNRTQDVFLWDRESTGLTLITKDSNGVSALGHSEVHSISEDGRFLTIGTDATSLPGTRSSSGLYLCDRSTGQFIAAEGWVPAAEPAWSPIFFTISPDAQSLLCSLRRRVGSPGQERLETQVIVVNRVTRRAIVVAEGVRGPGASNTGFSEVGSVIMMGPSFAPEYTGSADARFVVFSGEGREGRDFVSQAYVFDRGNPGAPEITGIEVTADGSVRLRWQTTLNGRVVIERADQISGPFAEVAGAVIGTGTADLPRIGANTTGAGYFRVRVE